MGFELPPVVDEKQIFPFKFWFNNSVQAGMYYRSELFYRLHSADVAQRARLFQYACRLSQQDKVVVTLSENSCSVWVSLRSPSAAHAHLHEPHFPEQSLRSVDSRRD